MRTDRYRLIQGSITVARVEGYADSAQREIQHYALVYAQDGPVRIERLVNNRWEIWPPIMAKST